jgi:membrane associated rhomboid family serine protease
MSSIREEIKNTFSQGDALTRLIIANISVFIVIILLNLFSFFLQIPINTWVLKFIALPTDLLTFLTRPWTLVSYMFLHEGFFHLLFNMLWLFYGGMIFKEFMGARRLLGTYLWGGLAGGLLYMIMYNIMPIFSDVVSTSTNRGASAGVMAVIIAAATYAPNYVVRLFFVLDVKLWVIAALSVLLDLMNIPQGNAGGHIAHLGGAIFGYLMVKNLRNGKDLTEGILSIVDSIENFFTQKRTPLKKVHVNKSGSFIPSAKQQAAQNEQQKLNEILDKINRSGYDSLSKEEKDFLFNIGKN